MNPYKILEIDKTATPEEIKISYRQKSKQYHPDLNKSKDAVKNYILVQEAYEALKKAQPEIQSKSQEKPPKRKTKAEKKAEKEANERIMQEGLKDLLAAQKYARRYDNIQDVVLAVGGIGVMYLIYILPSYFW